MEGESVRPVDAAEAPCADCNSRFLVAGKPAVISFSIVEIIDAERCMVEAGMMTLLHELKYSKHNQGFA